MFGFAFRCLHVLHFGICQYVSHVNDSIYAFAILATFRLNYWQSIERMLNGTSDQCRCVERKTIFLSQFETFKYNAITIGYIIEDGPELFLEYFFIEKYLYGRRVWYFIPHNFILGLIYLYSICQCCKIAFNIRRSMKSNEQTFRSIYKKINLIYIVQRGFCYILAPSIGIVQLMRCVAAVYYYVKDDLNPNISFSSM